MQMTRMPLNGSVLESQLGVLFLDAQPLRVAKGYRKPGNHRGERE